MDIETFLYRFCESWEESWRMPLDRPFVQNRWKIGTDGRRILALPTAHPDTSIPDGKRLPRSASDVLKDAIAPWPKSTDWPTIRKEQIIFDERESGDEWGYVVLDWSLEVCIRANFYFDVLLLHEFFPVEWHCEGRDKPIYFRCKQDFVGVPRFAGAVMPVNWWDESLGGGIQTVKMAVESHKKSVATDA